jgi:hypothetical protein
MSGIYRFLEQKKITNLQYLTDRLKHAVFIGKNNDWMFVETPKCACSSLKRALIALEGETIDFKHVGMESSLAMSIHSRDVNPINGISLLSEDTISTLLNSKKITKFCIVRNPYARLASAWADKIRQREPGYIRLIEPINKYNNMDNTHSTPSFSDFVNWLVNKNKSDHCNYHWASMKTLLLPDIIKYDHVVKTENISNELPKILDDVYGINNSSEYLDKFRLNESLYIDWKKLYTKELADKVYDFYKSDFDYYHYNKDSWLGKSVSKREHAKKIESTALQAIINRNETIHHLLTNQKLAAEEVDFLRDFSVSLINTRPRIALKLMLLAQKFRPNGEFINSKVNEIEKIIGAE